MKMLKHALTAATLAVAATPALAIPVTSIDPVPGVWYAFDAYDDIDSGAWVDENLDAIAFAFTTATPAVLRVVDTGLTGDRFEVLNNGVSLGLTSAPGDAGDALEFDYDTAAADGRWSYGAFQIAPGSYVITGRAVTFAPDTFAASGGVMLTPVPEPTTVALMGIGGILMFSALRRHAK